MIKTKKLNITFTSENKTTAIGFKLFVNIVKNLEDIKENESLFELLAHSHISAVREEIDIVFLNRFPSENTNPKKYAFSGVSISSK